MTTSPPGEGASRPSADPAPPARMSRAARRTKETTIEISVNLDPEDGAGRQEVRTGLPFFDHMLETFGRHGAMDLQVVASGDLEVDAHHTVEDVGIVLGGVLREALGDKAGIERFGWALLPLDEAMVEVALDCSGRAFLVYEVTPPAEALPLGDPPFDPQLAEEFWRALAGAAGLTLHLRQRSGKNAHHVLEASFKGAARAFRQARRRQGDAIASTKGMLS